ncbi:hypothetical protein AGMMS49992_20780 [Clostridia bacterium]|nr:hypothetical protein AGMMS49992_20780 [Clostridia bacterium]
MPCSPNRNLGRTSRNATPPNDFIDASPCNTTKAWMGDKPSRSANGASALISSIRANTMSGRQSAEAAVEPRLITAGSTRPLSGATMSAYVGGADTINLDMENRRAQILNNAFVNTYTTEQIINDWLPKKPPAELTNEPLIGESGLNTSVVMASPQNSSCNLHSYSLKIPAVVDEDTGEDVPPGEIDVVPYQSDTEGCVPPQYFMEPIQPPVTSADGCGADVYRETDDRMREYDSPQARVPLSDRQPSVLCAISWLLANGYGLGTNMDEWSRKLGAPTIDKFEAQYITQAAIWIAEGVIPESSHFGPCGDSFSGDPSLTAQNDAIRQLVNMAREYASTHECERNDGDPIRGITTPRGGEYYPERSGSLARMVSTDHGGRAQRPTTRARSISALNTCSADGTQVCAKYLGGGSSAFSHLIPGRDVTVRIVCGRLLVGPFRSCTPAVRLVAACGCMNGFSYMFTDYCGNPLYHKTCMTTDGTNGGDTTDEFYCADGNIVCMHCNANVEGVNAADELNRDEFYVALRITQKYLCFQLCSDCRLRRSVTWFMEDVSSGRHVGMRLSNECNYWQQIIETECTCVCVELPIDEPNPDETVHLQYPPILFGQTPPPVIHEEAPPPIVPDPIVFLSPAPPDPPDPPVFPPPVLLPPPQRPVRPQPTIFAPPIVLPQKCPPKPAPIPPPPRPILEAPRPPAPVLPPLPTPPPILITPYRTVQRPVMIPPPPPIPASALGAVPAAVGRRPEPQPVCQPALNGCPPTCAVGGTIPLQAGMNPPMMPRQIPMGQFMQPGARPVGVIPPHHEGECGIACGEVPVIPLCPRQYMDDTVMLEPMPQTMPQRPGTPINPTVFMQHPNAFYPTSQPGLTCPPPPSCECNSLTQPIQLQDRVVWPTKRS